MTTSKSTCRAQHVRIAMPLWREKQTKLRGWAQRKAPHPSYACEGADASPISPSRDGMDTVAMNHDLMVAHGESRDADRAINERAQEHARHPETPRPLGPDGDGVQEEHEPINDLDDEEEAHGYGHGV